MEFARVLRETRKRMGLKQSEMAERLGISRASLSLYETGKQTPGLKVLDALHTVTGAPLDYLMGYTDNYTVEAEENVAQMQNNQPGTNNNEQSLSIEEMAEMCGCTVEEFQRNIEAERRAAYNEAFGCGTFMLIAAIAAIVIVIIVTLRT